MYSLIVSAIPSHVYPRAWLSYALPGSMIMLRLHELLPRTWRTIDQSVAAQKSHDHAPGDLRRTGVHRKSHREQVPTQV